MGCKSKSFSLLIILVSLASSITLVPTLATLQPAQAKILFDIFTRVDSTGNYTYGTDTTISLNQTLECVSGVGYIQSEIFPPANYVWYVNGGVVKSETIGDSTYIFIPKTLGRFTITLTVNGESNSQAIAVTVVSTMPTATPTPIASPTPTATIPEFSSLAIQLSLIIMVVVAGLLVYFKKRKGSHNL
jgi:hypothetical protein